MLETSTQAGLDVRADFPILARELEGGRLVYLDSSSTSQKPAAVLDALDDYYRNHNANIHRGVYKLAQEADALFEGARERIAAFVNRPVASTIFTRNVTEAINLVAYSWARTNLRPGDAVLISEMEHHSNIVPWQLATAATGARASLPRGLPDRRHALARAARPRARPRRRRTGRADPHLERARHDQPGRGDRPPGPRRRRAGADRRRPGGAAAAGRPRRDRRRLLRLDGAQGARPDRRRRAARPRRAARADAAIPLRRRHDRDGRGAALDLERAAVEVRGGNLDDRPGRRSRRRGRLPRLAGHGGGARARAGADRLRARAAGAHRRRQPVRAARRPRIAAA